MIHNMARHARSNGHEQARKQFFTQTYRQTELVVKNSCTIQHNQTYLDATSNDILTTTWQLLTVQTGYSDALTFVANIDALTMLTLQYRDKLLVVYVNSLLSIE